MATAFPPVSISPTRIATGSNSTTRRSSIPRPQPLVNANLGYKLASGWEFSIWRQTLTNENIVIYGNDFWFETNGLATAIANPHLLAKASQLPNAAPRITV
jgi:hypothetical protein